MMASFAASNSRRSQEVVLVTGASGYIALHCVQQLLAAGYSVRGTVRSIANVQKVDPLRRLGEQICHWPGQLELVEADLECAGHWPPLVLGCSHILHVASPWPIVADQGTVRTAVQGTMNVLRAAAENATGPRKVILTSSCAAVNDGHRNGERVFDERCWTDLDSPRVDDYAMSKTLAERAAWEFWRSLDPSRRFQLVVLNPTFVLGPVLSSASHGSAIIVRRMLSFRKFPAAPKACLGAVDVRDVAKAHLLALEREGVDGERILVTHPRPVWFSDITQWLRRHFGPKGFTVTPLTAPNWLLRLYSRVGIDRDVRAVVHRLGPELRFDNRKSVELLGMDCYIEPERAVVEMAQSMVDRGMIGKGKEGRRRMMAKDGQGAEKEQPAGSG